MKLGVGNKWLTHLLAASAGMAGWYASDSQSPAAAGHAPQQQTQSSKARNSSEGEVIRRLTEVREDLRKSREESAKAELSPTPPDSRPWSQRLLEIREQNVPIVHAELESLLKRSKDYERIDELRVPLMEALQGNGGSDAAAAIFLEWHRRDPLAAFNELAVRKEWSRIVLSSDAMMLFLTPEELLVQMAARNRSADFRELIVDGVAGHLIDTDDLQGLSNYYERLDPVWAKKLMSGFIQREWVPRDGPAALAFVSNGMNDSCRMELMMGLSNVRPDHSSREWSNGIASSLFREVLGPEKLAEFQKKAEDDAKLPVGGCCGGGGDEEILPDQEAVARYLLEKNPEAFDRAVGRMLQHDKDYPELFAAGRISGDEALREMMAAIPGSEEHEDEVRRAVYRNMAEWNPKVAIEWASGCLTDEDMRSVSEDFHKYDVDPRALRLLEIMEVLPSKFSDGRFHGSIPAALHDCLFEWRVMAPEVAESAMTRSSAAIALAERLKVKPEDGSDFLAPLLPSDVDENHDNSTPEDP